MWANPESKGRLGTLSPEERGLPVKEESQGYPSGSGVRAEAPGGRWGTWMGGGARCPHPEAQALRGGRWGTWMGGGVRCPHPEARALRADRLQVQPLHSLHENGALVPLGDALYATGGRWQGMAGDYRVEMEAYDRGRDAWVRLGAMPRLWLYHGASAVFLDVSKWTQPFGPAPEP